MNLYRSVGNDPVTPHHNRTYQERERPRRLRENNHSRNKHNTSQQLVQRCLVSVRHCHTTRVSRIGRLADVRARRCLAPLCRDSRAGLEKATRCFADQRGNTSGTCSHRPDELYNNRVDTTRTKFQDLQPFEHIIRSDWSRS